MNVGKRIDEEVAPHLIHELRRRSPCVSCHATASSPRRISSLSKMASTTPNVASLAVPSRSGAMRRIFAREEHAAPLGEHSGG